MKSAGDKINSGLYNSNIYISFPNVLLYYRLDALLCINGDFSLNATEACLGKSVSMYHGASHLSLNGTLLFMCALRTGPKFIRRDFLFLYNDIQLVWL